MLLAIGLQESGGLSPLARGNQRGARVALVVEGPIPARAGKPSWPSSTPAPHRAYPRSRGETPRSVSQAGRREGLSPLARGNLVHHREVKASPGPIPARAGKPRLQAHDRAGRGAYPRSRGETHDELQQQFPRSGLSPLARGNPWTTWQSFGRTGLSPLARGNRRGCVLGAAGAGPIPARAGKPRYPWPKALFETAYPRSRGETPLRSGVDPHVSGLSPLARGNPNRVSGVARLFGPIPARAGKPRCWSCWPSRPGAYPRSRGETRPDARAPLELVGLSPLARGNPQQPGAHRSGWGPIPARAGKPLAADVDHVALGAYPRSRGETTNAPKVPPDHAGLSPLARGNRGQSSIRHRLHGPIPARAGKPQARQRSSRCSGAYPRSRGET